MKMKKTNRSTKLFNSRKREFRYLTLELNLIHGELRKACKTNLLSSYDLLKAVTIAQEIESLSFDLIDYLDPQDQEIKT